MMQSEKEKVIFAVTAKKFHILCIASRPFLFFLTKMQPDFLLTVYPS